MESVLNPLTELVLNFFPFGGFFFFLNIVTDLLNGLAGLFGVDIGFIPV